VPELSFTDAELDRLAELLADRVAVRVGAGSPAEHRAAPLADVMLTCSQAAQRAGTHVETIRRAIRSGALSAGRLAARRGSRPLTSTHG